MPGFCGQRRPARPWSLKHTPRPGEHASRSQAAYRARPRRLLCCGQAFQPRKRGAQTAQTLTGNPRARARNSRAQRSRCGGRSWRYPVFRECRCGLTGRAACGGERLSDNDFGLCVFRADRRHIGASRRSRLDVHDAGAAKNQASLPERSFKSSPTCTRATTLRSTCVRTPFSSITKVERSIRMRGLPSLICSVITP